MPGNNPQTVDWLGLGKWIACWLLLFFLLLLWETGHLADGSERQLWKRLPRKYRAKLGEAGGAQPGDEVLAFLIDNRTELGKLIGKLFGPTDSEEREAACDIFTEL